MSAPLLSFSGELKPYTYTFTSDDISKYESIQKQREAERRDDKVLMNLLIEGYVRTEVHMNNDYLFPIDVKEMIVSYYSFDLRAYIKSKKEAQKLQRAAKLQREKCANYWRLALKNNINIFLLLIPLITSMAAITISFIAYYSESNGCNDNYTIMNPIMFTLIGSALCLSHALFIGIHRFIALLCFYPIGNDEILFTVDWNTYLNDIKQKHKWLYLTDTISKWIMLLFYLVWSMFGFYIFQNKISVDCTQSNIGKMMISWSVIIFILSGYYCALEQKQESKKKLFCLFAPFIMIFIISHNEDMLCIINYSILKPTDFTIIGGSVSILHIICILIIPVDIAAIVSWIICIFYFVWSILGFYIYHNQLSSNCIQTTFATLFIIWSIFAFIISFLYHIYFAWTQLRYQDDIQIRIFSKVICTDTLLFLSIAVTIVAIYGDESICNIIDETGVYWDIPGFVLVAGVVSSTYFIIALSALYVKFFFFRYGVTPYGLGSGFFLIVFIGLCTLSILVLYLVLCINGFVFYVRMSNECKTSILGQMLISWTVITLILGPCYIVMLIYELLDRSLCI